MLYFPNNSSAKWEQWLWPIPYKSVSGGNGMRGYSCIRRSFSISGFTLDVSCAVHLSFTWINPQLFGPHWPTAAFSSDLPTWGYFLNNSASEDFVVFSNGNITFVVFHVSRGSCHFLFNLTLKIEARKSNMHKFKRKKLYLEDALTATKGDLWNFRFLLILHSYSKMFVLHSLVNNPIYNTSWLCRLFSCIV